MIFADIEAVRKPIWLTGLKGRFPDDVDASEAAEALSARARELLQFSSPRDPAQLARFPGPRV
ncbi:hypothetical protein [Streptomyces sp. NPDC016845]|uniref:hypothetical protein n=1 Tax=Streptomyces sp. NPDC016845 TaxID=3364972 RepID=UPI0037AED95F